jgi:parallel beta-helix repeat protein
VDGGGSANIVFNHITEIRDEPFSGCQNGVAILVGRNFEGQTGQANILYNVIDRYQKNGPTVDNAGSSAVIRYNRIVGAGPTAIIAQNGIQISRGATADVRYNQVTDNAYIIPPNAAPFTAAGILLYQPGHTTVVSNNHLNGNQDGVDIITSVGNQVSDNRIIGGLPPINPALGAFTFGDGIFADTDTANNHIVSNYVRDSVQYDCEDDSAGPNTPPALVANVWTNNDGVTQNRPGLCRPSDHEDDDRHGHKPDEAEGDDD